MSTMSKRCLRLVRKELDKFMQKPLSDAQLKAAKKQIKGQIGVACDNRENFALDFGKSFLHYGWEKNVDRLYEQVDEDHRRPDSSRGSGTVR